MRAVALLFGEDCRYSFTATVVNHQYWIVCVICRLVHVHVIRLQSTGTCLFWHYACVLGCVSWLARRSGTRSRSVWCIQLGSVHTPSRVRSAHLPPRSPTRCLSTCASVLQRLLSDPPAVPPATHACPIGAGIVDGLTGFSFVTCPACQNRTLVAVNLILGFFLPTDQASRTRCAAASASCSLYVTFCGLSV